MPSWYAEPVSRSRGHLLASAFSMNRFVFETVPELAVTYGPRLMLT
jgi:hypothetical protein